MVHVQERIAHAAEAVGRRPDDVRLLVVTKGHPAETVQAAIHAGARMLGENYAEEAVSKMTAIPPIPELQWHMIGHVQSRKAKVVAAHFDWVHSLDSLKLAVRLNRFSQQNNHRLPVLLECNLSGEASKSGWPLWKEADGENYLPQWEQIFALPFLEVRGLMTVPPIAEHPEDVRPYFRQLRILRDKFARQYPNQNWEQLSMGMSADFEIAIQEGATMVRVGTAIMGPRMKK